MFIGIDGGGSGGRIALARAGQLPVVVETGPANVTLNMNDALANLAGGLDALAGAAGISREALRDLPAHAGLAGALSPKITPQVVGGLGLSRLTLSDDRMCGTLGALGPDAGVVAGIGTGSYIGHSDGQAVKILGGWGIILGDQASGAWLGRHALREAILAHDGLVAATPLTQDLLSQLNGPAGAVEFARTARAKDMADLAPKIVAAALDGDAVGIDLMGQGAAYIATSARALGWVAGEKLCLIGGLGPKYAPFLSPDLQAALSTPRGNVLDGALELARRAGAGAPVPSVWADDWPKSGAAKATEGARSQ